MDCLRRPFPSSKKNTIAVTTTPSLITAGNNMNA